MEIATPGSMSFVPCLGKPLYGLPPSDDCLLGRSHFDESKAADREGYDSVFLVRVEEVFVLVLLSPPSNYLPNTYARVEV